MSSVSTEKGVPPAPLDPFGNEVCLLFLKYGKCRYKKKCKKSHILPDKNAPIMRMVTPAVDEPVVKTGPRIAFSVRKTPYAKPSLSTGVASSRSSSRSSSTRLSLTSASQKAFLSEIDRSGSQEQRSRQSDDGPQPMEHVPSITVYNASLAAASRDTAALREIPEPVPMPKTVGHEPVQQPDIKVQESSKSRRKFKRPAKASQNCLLASLFRTTIPDSAVSSNLRYHSPISTTETRQRHLKEHQERAMPKLFVKEKSKQSSKPSTIASKITSASTSRIEESAHSHYSTNESGASGDRIEQWYITNKAHLDPKTRRLLVLSKPTTVRQHGQLKVMRKHHWECKTQIERYLRNNLPTVFSLKIARDRIDWRKVAPYISMMIQAAFRMDINHHLLPIIGSTLCALLEHKNLSALACEDLLVSWGLTELDARRFTSHLWEFMVAAVGEAPVWGGKGVGYRIRQSERTRDFKQLQHKLELLNNKTTPR